MDIPFYALDFSDDFGRIQDYFVEEYVAGRTPNPCVMCNNWLKFGKLLEYADDVGAEFVATGHYARLARLDGPDAPPALLRGVDDGKDQAYVLFGGGRSVLDRMLLPIGDYKKDAIRELAREIGLRVAEKKDSQEICFVPDDDYAAFVRSSASASWTRPEKSSPPPRSRSADTTASSTLRSVSGRGWASHSASRGTSFALNPKPSGSSSARATISYAMNSPAAARIGSSTNRPSRAAAPSRSATRRSPRRPS